MLFMKHKAFVALGLFSLLMLIVAGCSQEKSINLPGQLTTEEAQNQTENPEPPVLASVPGYDCPPNSMWDFRWPWRSDERWYIYAGYHRNGGSPYHYGLNEYAVDLHRVGEGSLGRWVLAPAYGTVIAVGRNPSHSFGYYIKMSHGNGYESLVAHLRDNPYYLQVGDVLLRGTFLGYCGSTGNSTGAHIHFRVTRYGQPVVLTGISGYSSIVRWGQYWSYNAYVPPPRGFNP